MEKKPILEVKDLKKQFVASKSIFTGNPRCKL